MRPNGLHSEVLQTAMKEEGMWIWKFRDPKSEMKSHCHALLFQTAMHPVIIYCHRLLCIQLSSIQTFKPTGRPVGVPIQKETANVDDNNTNQQATTNNQPYHFSSKQTKPWRQHPVPKARCCPWAAPSCAASLDHCSSAHPPEPPDPPVVATGPRGPPHLGDLNLTIRYVYVYIIYIYICIYICFYVSLYILVYIFLHCTVYTVYTVYNNMQQWWFYFLWSFLEQYSSSGSWW